MAIQGTHADIHVHESVAGVDYGLNSVPTINDTGRMGRPVENGLALEITEVSQVPSTMVVAIATAKHAEQVLRETKHAV